MKIMLKKIPLLILSLSFLCILTSAQYLFASPSRLNNIPTADVVPERVLVLQDWVDVGSNKVPVYHSGFKYGPLR